MERLNHRILRRTRVAGTFPDGNSALMLVCATLRHDAVTQCGNKTPEEKEALFAQTFVQQMPEADEGV